MSVEVQSLSRIVRGQKHLDGVSFAFPNGLFAVLAPPGGGKTTLVSVLATHAAPTEGTVLVGGQDLVAERRQLRDRIAYVPAGATAPGRFTVKEALDYSAVLHGLTQEAARNVRTHRAAERMRLADVLDSPVESLPLGTQRQVAIAQALVIAPVLVLADEPTADLHPTEAWVLRDLLGRLAEETPVLVTTASVEETGMLAGGLLVLDRGRPLYAGSISHLLSSFDGRTWGILTAWEQSLPSLNGAVRTGLWSTPSGRLTRCVAGAPPHPDARSIMPLLEDAYAVLLAHPPA